MTPTSATGTDLRAVRTGAAGFTLVELMVVLALLGVLSAAVVMTLPDGRGEVRAEAEALAVRLQRAREEALLTNRAVEVVVGPSGYDQRILRRGVWTPLETPPFTARRWREGVSLEPAAGPVAVRFEPTGAAAPATLTLRRADRRIAVSVDGAGEVSIHAPGA